MVCERCWSDAYVLALQNGTAQADEYAKLIAENPTCPHAPRDTLKEHQAKAGRSRSAKKLAAVNKNLEKAHSARTQKNPSASALYQRQRRARLNQK